MSEMTTAQTAIDADDCPPARCDRDGRVAAHVEGHLHARVDRRARSGFTVPVDQLTALDPATVDAARRYVADL